MLLFQIARNHENRLKSIYTKVGEIQEPRKEEPHDIIAPVSRCPQREGAKSTKNFLFV